jgi:pimeloyl-ACP methyl ester carboxylesterase
MIRSNFYYNTQSLRNWIEIRYPIFAIPDRNRVILRIGQSNFNLAGVLPKVYQPILDSLPTITQSTLIIWGEFDRIIPVKHAYIAAKNIPNNELHIFPNCGHHPYLEYPEKFNQLVIDFLYSDPK